MMHIVQVSTYPKKDEKHSTSTGGVASYTKNLVNSLPLNKDDELSVICNKIDYKNMNYKEGRVNVMRAYDRKPTYIFKIYSKIKKLHPDIIHVQQELGLYGSVINAFLLQWLMLMLRKYNTVITLHGVVSLKEINKEFIKGNNSNLPVWLTKTAFKIIYKPLCRYSSKIVVHENFFKEILTNEYKTDGSKIFVVHHGVEDFNTIGTKLARKRLGLPETKNICLFMGYLTGYKGIDLLIEGFRKYALDNQNAFLVIGAGKHPKLKDDEYYLKNEYTRLQGKAKELIDSDKYIWAGFIEEKDITTYYSAADISVYPYTVAMSSSGPMAISIGHTKPFIASDAFAAVFNDKLLFNKNADALCEKLKDYFISPYAYRKHIQSLKIERIWSNVGARTYELYQY